MIYIYLNTYDNGYLYVGSHKWSGEGIDPNYHGSSTVAKKFNWIPIKEEILEVVSEDRKLVAEREWIEKYCHGFGVAALVKGIAHYRGNYWVDQFKTGLMLNEHSNSAYQMHVNGHTEEAIKKQCLSRSKWFSTDEGRQFLKRLHNSTKTKEALAKYSKSRIMSRKLYRLSDGFEGDYVDIANYLGFSASSCRKWLNDQRNLPKRFGNISAVQIPR